MSPINSSVVLKARLIKTILTTWLIPLLLITTSTANAATALADKPLFSGSSVPGNVALVISAEFPTALGSAYTAGYTQATKYVGYFDSEKCYAYANRKVDGLYNTGVDDNNTLRANGLKDLHWAILSKPATAGVSDEINTTSYIPSTSTARTLGAVRPMGAYIYRTTFTIPTGTDLSQVKINFTVGYDDILSNILVNAVTVPGYINQPLSFGIPIELTNANSALKIGSNTLDINILNTGGDLGIRVDDVQTKSDSFFAPVASANNHACNAVANGRWSGNFLNWALTQTVDPFRFALTGGYRAIDAVGLTVLEKAWASGQGGSVASPTINNNQALIAQSTPFDNLNTIQFRIAGLGNKLYFTGTGNNNNPGTNLIAEGAVPATPDATKVYQMFARVKVCDPALLESNCTKYPNGDYKPTGLMQKNAMKLNFAAFGYLNDANIQRDGGVLRAKMNAVGPRKTVPNAPDVVNANSEWNENTGIFNKNPDAVSAAASTVTRSGAINYLNEFGLTTPGYKTFDPVGELYYTAIRYFKNQGNVAAYSSGLTAAQIDGFPVIDFKKDIDDPIKYSCQANFVIGIGDTNTHADSNLPGSSIRSGNEPALPAEVSADTSVSVRTSTNKVGELQGLGNLGERYTPWCCSNNSFFMAGLAYDAHTKDMRPNDFKIAGLKSKIQTLETYWLDVLESGDRSNDGGAGMRNQFWLTAKYGGFVVPEGFAPYATGALAPTLASWDKDNNGDPDNYFRANNPQAMIDGLTSAFEDIASKVGGSSISFALASPFVSSGSLAFSTSYDPDGWVGNVVASTISFDTSNNTVSTNIWSAKDKLAMQNWDTQRFIATSKCETTNSDGTKGCVGVPFRLTSLLAANATQLSASGDPQKVLNFLRGDRSNEGGATNFRIRKSVFGDIVTSKVVVVGQPAFQYGESTNPGYSAFKTTYASRVNVAYVGANDGFLHAIKATNDANGGQELFAYVPSQLFNGPNATPATDGIGALSKAAFVHYNYVDSTPVYADVNFGGGNNDWHTLLVGGLGKGGKGYYAIDITNPATLSNEANLASAVKWEFTHKDLGYSYGKPIITKVNINDGTTIYNGWAVIVTSGYNNTDNNGYFFILNAKTGALIKQVKTHAISPASDAGLAAGNAYISNFNDYVADTVYAGDLLGNVWRLNLKTLGVTNLAYLTDGTLPQPITTAPNPQVDQSTGKRYVLVGTGKLLDDSDAPNTQTHSFYAINDGMSGTGAFFETSTLPSGVTFPIKRANLNNNSNTYKVSGVTAPAANSLGWYIDLEDKYRINVDNAANAGFVAFAANKTGGSECSPDGVSRTYELNYSNGKSVTPAGFLSSDIIATNVQYYKKITAGSTNVRAQVKTSFKNNSETDGASPGEPISPNFKLLNWRDLPTAD